jgi:hypothetical protein
MAAVLMFNPNSFAGNPDRAGSAGGMQLLVNPWAGSNALSGANMASASPVESMFQNVAGMANVEKTEVGATHINYLSGADVGLNTFGLAQRVGETGAIGIAVSAFDFGDIRRTTNESPDGDGTSFNVQLVSFGLSYAKAFSNSIYGGITVKVLSEGVADLRASGVAFDAGIKYITGDRDQLKFGITLKNIGPPMSFSGDGLSFETTAPGNQFPLSSEFRSANYELPSLVSIGASYDFLLNEDMYLTAHGAFVANSFSEDNYLVGAEYSFKDLVFLRAGYLFENNIFNDDFRRVVYTGLSVGAGLELELGKKGTRIAFDYAYRATNPFNGLHAIGVRFAAGKK